MEEDQQIQIDAILRVLKLELEFGAGIQRSGFEVGGRVACDRGKIERFRGIHGDLWVGSIGSLCGGRGGGRRGSGGGGGLGRFSGRGACEFVPGPIFALTC